MSEMQIGEDVPKKGGALWELFSSRLQRDTATLRGPLSTGASAASASPAFFFKGCLCIELAVPGPLRFTANN